MAKFVIPKIVKRLDLRRYAAELVGDLDVWVNPPREKLMVMGGYQQAVTSARVDLLRLTKSLRRLEMIEVPSAAEAAELEQVRDELIAVGTRLDELGRAQQDWFREMWSQGADAERHWSAEEVQDLVRHSYETDPGLWRWLCDQTLEMIEAHRAQVKKA